MTIFSRVCAASLMLFAAFTQATTQVTVTVDRNPVMVNESFVLEIVANDSLDGNDLDLTPIRQSGLVVGRTATSSQTQIINGSISKTTSWNVVLLARKEGQFIIPSLTIDGVSSTPITVNVIKSSTANGQTNQPIFLKNTIEQTELYLQQTVKLVTRLYFAPNIDLQSGTLTDPSLDGAAIKQHGKDKDSSEIIMGVRYRIIERVYTLTPQSSGRFTITSPAFNGEISTGRRRSSFSNFGGTKPVTSLGNDIVINVKSIPQDYSGPWLPSELVMLNEEWQPEQDSYEVGEPITRTFTLTALNVNEEQLPEITGTYPSSFKTYPDQSESHSDIRQNAIVSQRISTEAIVATQPGEFTLPEVKVSWFNTKTKRQEVATIASKNIIIKPSSNAQAATPVTNLQSPIQQTTISENNQCLSQDEAGSNIGSTGDDNSLNSLIKNSNWFTWLGWGLWLFTLAAWFTRAAVKPQSKMPEKQEQSTSAFNSKALKKACSDNDANEVRIELLKWARCEFSQSITSLTELSKVVNPELQQQITQLQASKYSKQPSAWTGKDLWRAFSLYRSNKPLNKKDELPSLYH